MKRMYRLYLQSGDISTTPCARGEGQRKKKVGE
jgi:hypothetical protein